MKRAFAALAAASALALAGCADELEQPTTQEVGERFQRGVSGQGTIGPLNRADDPYLRSNEPSAPEPRPQPQLQP
ncbi:MAG: hypothetical protein M3O66_01410 [Verrucomicrobiota bacterium]|jgi:hypothetical protein|nr:hypothetical protein [Verrucomicrobiota bacterium]